MDSTLVQEWLLLLLQSRRQHKHGEWMQYFEYWFNLEVHFFVVLIPMIVVLPLQSQVQSQNPSPLYSNGGTPNIKKFHFPQSTHQLKKKRAAPPVPSFSFFLSFFNQTLTQMNVVLWMKSSLDRFLWPKPCVSSGCCSLLPWDGPNIGVAPIVFRFCTPPNKKVLNFETRAKYKMLAKNGSCIFTQILDIYIVNPSFLSYSLKSSYRHPLDSYQQIFLGMRDKNASNLIKKFQSGIKAKI